jgi:hypothetical protein
MNCAAWASAPQPAHRGVLGQRDGRVVQRRHQERLIHRTEYATRDIAKRDIARYVELFHNRQSLHSALGYRTPFEVHTEHIERTEQMALAA